MIRSATVKMFTTLTQIQFEEWLLNLLKHVAIDPKMCKVNSIDRSVHYARMQMLSNHDSYFVLCSNFKRRKNATNIKKKVTCKKCKELLSRV